MKIRCFGNGKGKEFYAKYHDNEWGIAVFDDRKLFEMLCLEGAQAGLSWETVLKKRQSYKNLFYNFVPQLVAKMKDEELEKILLSKEIIRHRLKVYSVRNNAKIFIDIQEKYGSFKNYIWHYVNGKQIINHWTEPCKVPTKTPLSDKISKDLKKKGMSFVGSTIIYAYMQAIGMVDDHLTTCHKRIKN